MWINHTSDSQSNCTDHKWFQNGCNKYVYPIHFVVYCYINNSLYSDWKYARILVCRHYLFWDVNSSERMKLEENCELWGTMMSKDKYTSIFSCQMEAIIFITLQIFLQCMDEIFFCEQFTVWGCLIFSVLRYDLVNKQTCPFSHLQSNFKRILEMQVSQLCAGRNIWWIILTDNTNHESYILCVYTILCIFQAVKDGRVPEVTSHSKGTKPYSCLTYFSSMLLTNM